MARRKNTRSKEQYHSAYELEKSGNQIAALKGYQKAVATDPTNVQAWNRQIIIFRKTKTKQQEINLIKTAITEYQKTIESNYQNWLKSHQEKAEHTLELAKVLGLLETSGMPKTEHAILDKWETRKYLLEYRVKNARPKKAKSIKNTIDAKPVKKKNNKSAKPMPKIQPKQIGKQQP
ncbi:MAG: hypothetical protein ABWZ79_15455 [Pedobacter agri]